MALPRGMQGFSWHDHVSVHRWILKNISLYPVCYNLIFNLPKPCLPYLPDKAEVGHAQRLPEGVSEVMG